MAWQPERFGYHLMAHGAAGVGWKREAHYKESTVRSFLIALAAIATLCGKPIAALVEPSGDTAPSAVEFSDCVESIGVGLVSTAQAEVLVPAPFIVVGTGTPVTPLVVRTSDCGGIAVDGGPTKAGSVVQIGVVIVPPDFTGDINSYTLFYYTSDVKLAHRLADTGLPAQHVGHLTYDVTPGAPGELHVRVPRPGSPALSVDGTVGNPAPAGSFVANWWVGTDAGAIKMSTTVPAITIGAADLVLTTNPGGALGHLIGGESIGFPLVQQFNAFAGAHMDVTHVP